MSALGFRCLHSLMFIHTPEPDDWRPGTSGTTLTA